jgi:FeS assembly SUF system regulator
VISNGLWMIRLSRLADYGVVLACHMAAKADRSHNAFDLASSTGLPAPTVSKLLAALARAGILVSHRGAKGGYRLARAPAQISAADIVGAVDGPIALTVCIEHGDGFCDVERLCPTRKGWRRINDAIRQAFEAVSLAELVLTPPAVVLPVAAGEESLASLCQAEDPARGEGPTRQ